MQLKNKQLMMYKFSPKYFFQVVLIAGIIGAGFSCKSEDPEAAVAGSDAYISKVYEYVYGPGQHAGIATMADTANFIGEPASDKWLFLGGFGGYVIAGFDHNVINGDSADFEVYAQRGSSPEPAVVYVMSDDNGDGLPNETWYELKGNQYDNTKHNYWVRYYKAKSETSNVTWKDSEGSTGQLVPGYGATNSSKWWWSGTATDSITFAGSRLPDSYINIGTDGAEYWVVPKDKFTWGYAENLYGNDYETVGYGNKLDISNAVDVAGKPVKLPSIRFIKLQTGVFQQAGWTNEVSSEVRGAKDLRK